MEDHIRGTGVLLALLLLLLGVPACKRAAPPEPAARTGAAANRPAPAAPPGAQGMPMAKGKAGVGMPPLMAGTATDSELVGQEAPEFTLPGSDGREFALADSRGKEHVLLYFYKGMW
jgi:hypothetical protein